MGFCKRLAVWLCVFCIGIPFIQSDAATWRTSTVRGFLFSADRGVVSDSVMQLSDATYYPVADTSGAVFYVKSGGTNILVPTRRKWMTSSNATIRAFPSYLAVADTAGQGVDATYLGGGRYQWYLQNANFGLWNFYEIGGSPDSAIAELQNVVVIGKVLPDSSVVTASLENQAVTLAKVDSSDVIAFENVRIHGRIYADSVFSISATGPPFVLSAAEDSSGSMMMDTLTVEHDLKVNGDSYLGDAVDDTVYVQGTLDAVQTVRITTNGLQADFIDSYDADLFVVYDNPADSMLVNMPLRVNGDLHIQGDITSYTESNWFGGTVILPLNKKQKAAYIPGLEADGYATATWYYDASVVNWTPIFVTISAAEDSVEFRTVTADLSNRTIMYSGRKSQP